MAWAATGLTGWGDKMALDLGKQVGPLPIGAWIAVVGGGLGIGWYFSKGAAKQASGNNVPLEPQAESGVGVGGGQFIYDPPTNVDTPDSNTITDNNTWANRAINWLIAKGYDPGLSQSAISKFINGTNRTLTEQAMINLALIQFGNPPENVPLPDTPVTPPTTTPPVTNPPTNTKPYTLYKVQPGENITTVAAKFKTSWWNIFVANDKVGLTPSGSHGVMVSPFENIVGKTLVIPTSAAALKPPPKTTGRYWYYTVQGRGESLFQIQAKTGVSVANIYLANDTLNRRPDGTKGIMTHPYQKLKPGVRVIIPYQS